ncbi:MAG TPA: topoisomerase C-terminal repeat-containing protein, partial [Steroidobacteraceae bacterium]
KPITVRMGRFGPFVQIGTKDDAEKPRFAGLRPGQKMDSIQLADAFELFKLPRTLGTTATGDTVLTAIGRFGPYVKYGAKYVSLKEDDPYTITLERALEVIQAKAIADANRIIQDFVAAKIQVLNGRYGPYITDGAKNARAPKDRDPKTLTLEECQALLAAAPAKNARGRFGRRLPAKAAAAGAAAGSPAGAAAGAPAGAPVGTPAGARSSAAAAAARTAAARGTAAPAIKVPARKARMATTAAAGARARRPKPAAARKKAPLKKTSSRRH